MNYDDLNSDLKNIIKDIINLKKYVPEGDERSTISISLHFSDSEEANESKDNKTPSLEKNLTVEKIKKNIAKNLLKESISHDIICKVTGLSDNELTDIIHE